VDGRKLAQGYYTKNRKTVLKNIEKRALGPPDRKKLGTSTNGPLLLVFLAKKLTHTQSRLRTTAM